MEHEVSMKIPSLGLMSIMMGCAGTAGEKAAPLNADPLLEVVSPEDGANILVGETVRFLAYTTDAESGPEDLRVSWTSDLDGDLATQTPDSDGNAGTEVSGLSQGAHRIEVGVYDPDGGQAEATLLLNIYDPGVPPEVVLILPLEDDYAIASIPFSVAAEVIDEDDSPEDLEVRFRLLADDEVVGEPCASTVDVDGVGRCTLTADEPGLFRLTVVVSDSLGNTASDELADFEVIAQDQHDGDEDGYSEVDGDCDDDDDSIHPEAAEVSDGIDNDCDGAIDEGTDSVDDDGDGFSELDGDCDDADGSRFPGAEESLDETDNDCDGVVDEGTAAFDDDGDCSCEGGVETATCTGSVSTSCVIADLITGDCDDADEDIHPTAPELCDDVDNDCDDWTDEDDPDTDEDGDGYSRCGGLDCDDRSSAVSPAAVETCNDVDDNCDGRVDEDEAEDATVWYFDSDGDTWGSSTTATACEAPPSHVIRSGDCDDTNPSINPGAVEVCDEDDTDEDCSGTADGPDATGKLTWYLDTDGDGYPIESMTITRCDPWGSYIAAVGEWDCDDSRAWVNPGEAEVCDYFDTDEDCDGEINEPGSEGGTFYFRDFDRDGFGDASRMEMLCEAGDLVWYDTVNNEDCCDYDGSANPDATTYRTIETACGGYDWNCDGSETKRWTHTGSCGTLCGTSTGWRYSAEPDCGEVGDWLYDCDIGFGCSRDYSAKTQECR